MYGVTKVAGELLCDYYHTRFGVGVYPVAIGVTGRDVYPDGRESEIDRLGRGAHREQEATRFDVFADLVGHSLLQARRIREPE